MIAGRVVSVSTSNLAEPTTAAASAGATVLNVADAATFDEFGGYVVVGSSLLQYVDADPETDTLTLGAALTVAVDDQELVEFYPPVPVKIALVDLGEDGDPIPVTVPHALLEALPDGVRAVDSGESVTIEMRDNFEYVVADLVGAPLATGTVDPERIAVGVVTNLVVDPNMIGDSWIPQPSWEIGRDSTGTFAGIGYLRSVNRAAADVVAAYADANDSTYFLTPGIAAEAGRTVRVACQVRRDAASIVSASGVVKAQARVVFFSEPVTLGNGTIVPPSAYSDSDVMGELELEFDTVADAWTPLTTVVTVPDGATSFRAMVQTRNQLAGTIDFIKPEVQVLWDRLQSPSYVEGSQGYSFNETGAQVQNLNVLEEIGADTVTARTIVLDGVDQAERNDATPQGVLVYARTFGIDTAAISTTRTITHELHGGSMRTGRIYRVTVHGHITASTTDCTFDLLLNYTTDGSTPTATSPILDGSEVRVPLGGTIGSTFRILCYYLPANDYDVTKFSLSMDRQVGTGTGYINGDVNRGTEFCIEDLGACDADVSSGGGGVLSQKSKSSGTADATPLVTYTKTYLATWAGSYQSSTTSSPYAERPDSTTRLYQGVSSTRVFGNQRSLFGLPYATIQSDLAGATIKSVYLTYRVQAAAGSDGIELHFNSHNYTTKPSTFNPANVNNDVAVWGARREGSTYMQSLGTSIGNSLKAGSIRGFGFGPAPTTSFDDYYGYCYGSGSSRPRVTITYTK